ncbi:hypothetical protein QLG13_13505 [Rhodococcus aetherivorans]|uniref:Uncharacterized protein n=2 Tax=Rhodococcus aetherivorans TaxID=191292 RepID=A0AA46NT41_9NOCA|nr:MULTISPECIES: hypothetical protein [Rhodococcus]UYF92048.1 hypothetical protein OCS65_16170 [Rhodococcus aetherivorans]WKX01205.1 hypothetical protein Q3O43_13320 [Rhodococcus aetherivorans]
MLRRSSSPFPFAAVPIRIPKRRFCPFSAGSRDSPVCAGSPGAGAIIEFGRGNPMNTNTSALSDQIRAVHQLVRTQLQILEIRHERSSHPMAKQQIAADIRYLSERCDTLERILHSHTTSAKSSSRAARLSDCIATIAGSADRRSVAALEHVLADQLADRVRTLESLAIALGDRPLQQWARGIHAVGAA